jgi:hypothetical protein
MGSTTYLDSMGSLGAEASGHIASNIRGPNCAFQLSRENKIDARKLKGYIAYADPRPRN